MHSVHITLYLHVFRSIYIDERRTYCLQCFFFYLQVRRVQVDSHLQSAMRSHLDLACVKLSNTEAKLNDTEQKLEATRKVVQKLDTRIFVWRINNFSVTLRQATVSGKSFKDSIPFYTDRTESYGYKLKVRIYPGGDRVLSDHLLVYIVVMKGEYDAILPWPFRRQVKLTVILQEEDPDERMKTTIPLIPENELNFEAFARPVKAENVECLGLAISHEMLHSGRYLVDDTLFLQVEVSPS